MQQQPAPRFQQLPQILQTPPSLLQQERPGVSATDAGGAGECELMLHEFAVRVYYEDTDMEVRRIQHNVSLYTMHNAIVYHASPQSGSGRRDYSSSERIRYSHMLRRSCNAVYMAKKWKMHVKYDKWGWGRFSVSATRPSEPATSKVWRQWTPRDVPSSQFLRHKHWNDVDEQRLNYTRYSQSTTCWYCMVSDRDSRDVCAEMGKT